jgi:hypothetical protein
MKINVELDITPEEFKELFAPSNQQLEMMKSAFESLAQNTNNPYYESYQKMVADGIDSFMKQQDVFAKLFKPKTC